MTWATNMKYFLALLLGALSCSAAQPIGGPISGGTGGGGGINTNNAIFTNLPAQAVSAGIRNQWLGDLVSPTNGITPDVATNIAAYQAFLATNGLNYIKNTNGIATNLVQYFLATNLTPYWTVGALGRKVLTHGAAPLLTLREDASPNKVLYFGDIGSWDAASFQVKGTNDGNTDPRISFVFDSTDELTWRFRPLSIHDKADVQLLAHDTAGNLFLGTNGTYITALGQLGGDGSGLTNLNASSLASGTVADARLSTNIIILTNRMMSWYPTFTDAFPDNTYPWRQSLTFNPTNNFLYRLSAGFRQIISGGANNFNELSPGYDYVRHDGSGTVTNGIANKAVISIQGQGDISVGTGFAATSQILSNGNIGNFYGFHAVGPSITGTGRLTNYYGLLVDPITSASGTTWGLYLGGTNRAYVGGNLLVYDTGVQNSLIDGTLNLKELTQTSGAGYDWSLGNQALRFDSTSDISWSDGATYAGTHDIGLKRASSGVLQVTDGYAGTGTGILKASNFVTPTNTPTDAYVLTATGTSGATKWAVATGDSGQTNNVVLEEGSNISIATDTTTPGQTVYTITSAGGADANNPFTYESDQNFPWITGGSPALYDDIGVFGTTNILKIAAGGALYIETVDGNMYSNDIAPSQLIFQGNQFSIGVIDGNTDHAAISFASAGAGGDPGSRIHINDNWALYADGGLVVTNGGINLGGESRTTWPTGGGGGTNAMPITLTISGTNVSISAATPVGCVTNAPIPYRLTLTTNVLIASATGANDGQRIVLTLIQDGTGSRRAFMATNYIGSLDTPITANELDLTTTASWRDKYIFEYRSSGDWWELVGRNRGYAP